MKILLVDDDVVVLRATARPLLRFGHEVRAHSNHDAARVDAEEWADVALVDVDMPERSGPELVRFFPRDLPVVFYTGNPEGVPRNARYLVKPATLSQIVEALRDEYEWVTVEGNRPR